VGNLANHYVTDKNIRKKVTMTSTASVFDVMEFLLANMAPNLPPGALAEVFDRLIWCLADNGKELLAIRDSWLQGDDRRKVAIAIAMDETLPFDGGSQMRGNLEKIADRWPEFTERCDELISAAKDVAES